MANRVTVLCGTLCKYKKKENDSPTKKNHLYFWNGKTFSKVQTLTCAQYSLISVLIKIIHVNDDKVKPQRSHAKW